MTHNLVCFDVPVCRSMWATALMPAVRWDNYRFGPAQRMDLIGTIRRPAVFKLIPIDQMRIEERPIHTGELDLVAYGYAAGPAHTGSIQHNRIQRRECFYAVRFGFLGRYHHHKGTSNRDNAVDFLAGIQFLRQSINRVSLSTHRAVNRCLNELVANVLTLILVVMQIM